MGDPRDTAPSLADQMAAQARLREGSSNQGDATKWGMGCMALLGLVVAGIALWVVLLGSLLAWWMWLTW